MSNISFSKFNCEPKILTTWNVSESKYFEFIPKSFRLVLKSMTRTGLAQICQKIMIKWRTPEEQAQFGHIRNVKNNYRKEAQKQKLKCFG